MISVFELHCSAVRFLLIKPRVYFMCKQFWLYLVKNEKPMLSRGITN
jgi:hypothetical protein